MPGEGGAARGEVPPIGVNPPAVACVDAEIVTVSAPCIEPHGSATAIVAPTCSCNGAACEGEAWGPPCTDP